MVENRLFTIPHFCVRSSGLRASPQLWAAILASLKCTKKTGDGGLLLGTFETNMRARNKKRSGLDDRYGKIGSREQSKLKI